MLDTKKSVKLACWIALPLAFGTAVLAAQQRSASAQRESGDLDKIRKVSTLIGAHVVNRANARVADVRDLVLSPDGAVKYAVLGFAGVAGVGESYTAAPFDVMNIRLDDGKWAVNLDMTAEEFMNAPTIRSEDYRELTDPQWIARVDQFFTPRSESENKERPDAGAAARRPRAVEQVILAGKIRGAKPTNTQNQELGKLEDLLLDREDRVAFVVLGRGGLLGIGANYIPIPWATLSLSKSKESAATTVTIDATKERLDKAPMINGDNYATLLARGLAKEVRHYFGVKEPEEPGTAVEGEKH
jgi:PRC-barrel domain